MAYATLMVHVDFDATSDARMRLAVDLSNDISATLIGIAAQGIAPVITWQGVTVGAQVTPAGYEYLEASLAGLEAQFREATRESRKPSEWRSATLPPTAFILREVRSADLVIVGRPPTYQDLYHSLDTTELLMAAGRPILIVPDEAKSLHDTCIVVAWKDTREARRAVQDSLPFLHEAERVFVAEVCEDGSRDEAHRRVSDVAHYLTRHRIKTATQVIVRNQNEAAEELIRLAQREGAGLIVAGAYGHSRLGEWIFGGVTRDLLHRSPVCCLFSH